MAKSKFVQTHPSHFFDKSDTFDYSERDHYFIQCLKAIEALMDIDAYILDYKNEEILYATKDCSIYSGNSLENIKKQGLHYYDKIIVSDDVDMLIPTNSIVFDFFYSLPMNKRRNFNGYYTHDFRIRNKKGKIILINHKITILDLTNDGKIRLGLCVISYPTNDKPGNAYLKMNDNSVVYQYMPSANKFVEVKTQKLTSRAMTILKLASNGKTEAEIAKQLDISIFTVKYHKKKIFSRIGVKNIAEAIQWMNNQKKLVKK